MLPTPLFFFFAKQAIESISCFVGLPCFVIHFLVKEKIIIIVNDEDNEDGRMRLILFQIS